MTNPSNDANPEITPPPVPPRPAAPEAGNVASTLLKNPQRISDAIAGQQNLLRAALTLLAVAIACHVVFGLALGLFGGWPVATMDMVKIPLVAICSLLLCFPSLYVFTCVAGAPLTLAQTFVLGCSCLAMVGLILVGLAPVAWLFAVSTKSLSFVTLLAFLIWLVAIGFAGRYVDKLGIHPLFQRQAGIKLWFLILMLVTLQMATCMRPMLTKPEKSWWTGEKQFFLSHFGSTLNHPSP
jgi:hypothetical protein